VHEAKLDGWRCLVEVSGRGVQVWSRRRGDYTARLPELQALSGLGDVVLDGELVVVSKDGRADFELLSTRVNGRKQGRLAAQHPVTLYVFDLLRQDGHDLCGEPWTARRAILDKLELATATSGVAWTMSYTRDGEAMHKASLSIGAEGTVSKKASSIYLPGRRVSWWTRQNIGERASFPSSDGDRPRRFGPAV
jgi:bifunctional non-homologous end joining protein LigD